MVQHLQAALAISTVAGGHRVEAATPGRIDTLIAQQQHVVHNRVAHTPQPVQGHEATWTETREVVLALRGWKSAPMAGLGRRQEAAARTAKM